MTSCYYMAMQKVWMEMPSRNMAVGVLSYGMPSSVTWLCMQGEGGGGV